MKNYLLIWMLTLSTIVTGLAQNYTISSYIGDDGDYWSGAYIYEFFYLGNSLSAAQDLPFDFNFYGQPVTSYRIAANGYITFDAPAGTMELNNSSLPNSGGANKAIYALWDDFSTAVTISTKTYGVTPNRVHQITWAGLNYPGAASFQDDFTVSLNLYESCNDFEVVIIENSIAPTSTFYSMINTTIGCENATGTLGAQVAGSPTYIPSDPGWQKDLYEVYRFNWNAPVLQDAALVAIDIDNHLSVGNHSLKGTIRNEGDAAIQSYTINYSLNGGSVQSASITANGATNSKTHQWIHSTPINIPSSSSQYELKVWVSNINGQADERPCNDTLVEYLTGINNVSSPKKVLLEEFTGAWCGHCIDGSVYVDNLMAQYGSDFIPVAVHDGDSMEFADGLRTAFTPTGYPNGVVDRKQGSAITDYKTESTGRGSWGSRVASQLNSFNPVEVAISSVWNPTTRVINATVTANYSDNSAGDARLVLMIVEDSLTGTGIGWNQANYYSNTTGHPYYGAGSSVVGFVHQHVLRDYVEGGPFGVDGVIPHQVQAGASYQHQFQYTLPRRYNADNITLVAAVAKYMPTNDAMYIGVRGQRYIYNAEQIPLKTLTSVTTMKAGLEQLTVFPNPTTGQVSVVIEQYNGEYALELYSVAGQLVATSNQSTIDLQTYPEGMYILRIAYENKVQQVKVVKRD